VTFAITLVYVWLVKPHRRERPAGGGLHVTQGAVSSAALGITGADADRMDWLTGTLCA
jgi:hypothetical protein